MVCGNVPFETDAQIRKARFHFPAALNLTSEVKDLIRLCLTPDPKDRITLREIARHPWLTSKTADLRIVHPAYISEPVNVKQRTPRCYSGDDTSKDNTFDTKGLTSSRSNYKDLSKFFNAPQLAKDDQDYESSLPESIEEDEVEAIVFSA
jgi:serine/threonine protein kinase